jgi:hypothetical protein
MSLGDSDVEIQEIASALWDKGQVVADKSAREVLAAAGVQPDVEFLGGNGNVDLDYIHRRSGETDIYFVANRSKHAERAVCVFRIAGKAPELWNPVSGERSFAVAYAEDDGRTSVPLEFVPCGSWFVVFRRPSREHPADATSNAPQTTMLSKVNGPWQVTFDADRGGPGTVEFPRLVSWTKREESGIKFYSGTAVYRTTFELPKNQQPVDSTTHLQLDLGSVRELAEVKVNGRSCGIVWSPPFQVAISDAVRTGENHLEIEVVNFWPNRIIGDAALPPEERLTRTNIRELTQDTELMVSGLLGPVTLQLAE